MGEHTFKNIKIKKSQKNEKLEYEILFETTIFFLFPDNNFKIERDILKSEIYFNFFKKLNLNYPLFSGYFKLSTEFRDEIWNFSNFDIENVINYLVSKIFSYYGYSRHHPLNVCFKVGVEILED